MALQVLEINTEDSEWPRILLQSRLGFVGLE